MGTLFRAGECTVRLLEERDLAVVLDIYIHSEDFLSLNHLPKASPEMVAADVAHSKESGGVYCIIQDDLGHLVGVLDLIPEQAQGTAYIQLLMISDQFRNRGHGRCVVEGLERYLKATYGTTVIVSGVQTTNTAAQRFWRRCGFKIDRTARAFDDGLFGFDMRKRLAAAN